MDCEQKYKDTIERLRTLINSAKKKGHIIIRIEDIKNAIPELAESEDEKIRKALIGYFGEQCDMSDWNGVYGYQVLAWLEKQESVGEIVERCKTSWYNEGKIAGMAEGLTDDEKYQQGWHDALEKHENQDEKKLKWCVEDKAIIEDIIGYFQSERNLTTDEEYISELDQYCELLQRVEEYFE